MSTALKLPDVCRVCGNDDVVRHSSMEYYCEFCGQVYTIQHTLRPDSTPGVLHRPSAYASSSDVEHFDPADPQPFLAKLAACGLEAVLVTNEIYSGPSDAVAHVGPPPYGPEAAVLVKIPAPNYGLIMITASDDVIFHGTGLVSVNPPIIDVEGL